MTRTIWPTCGRYSRFRRPPSEADGRLPAASFLAFFPSCAPNKNNAPAPRVPPLCLADFAAGLSRPGAGGGAGRQSAASALGRAVRGRARFHCAAAHGRAALLAPAFRQGHGGLVHAVFAAFCRCFRRAGGAAGAGARAGGRIHPVHLAATGAVHGGGRHSRAQQLARHAAGECRFSGRGGAAGQRDGHHGRVDGADSPAAQGQ